MFAFASHGLFSKAANTYISESVLEQVVVLNTIPLSSQSKENPKIVQLSVAPLLADAIRDCDSEIAVRIFGLFEDCTVSSTPFLQSSLRDILSACCAVCVMMLSNYKTIENTNIPDIIRRAACSCLTSQVDKFYHIIFEMVSLFALNDE